jgi:Fe2+ or Zn2+ uptake regulation protein
MPPTKANTKTTNTELLVMRRDLLKLAAKENKRPSIEELSMRVSVKIETIQFPKKKYSMLSSFTRVGAVQKTKLKCRHCARQLAQA